MIRDSKWPHFSNSDINEVGKLLKSGKVNYWTGEQCKKFEYEFGKYNNIKNCIAISNATVGLEMAMQALDIKNGDEVIVTSRSFIASASCVLSVNAKPVFADIDINSQNIDPESIERKISNKTKAIIIVHLSGYPCAMKKIMSIVKKNNIYLIEDCSQAHGAKIGKNFCGSWGDIAVWSFCNDKIISTGGEGGMISAKSNKIYKILFYLKDHGRSKFNVLVEKKYTSKFDNYGSNYRMTEIQALLGRLQLKRLDSMIIKRRKISEIYIKSAKKFKSIRIQKINKKYFHVFYKCYFFINKKYIKKEFNRNILLEKLTQSGIEAYSGVCPELYNENVFREYKPKKRYKNCMQLGDTSFLILVHPTQTYSSVKQKAKMLEKILREISIE